MYHFSTYFDRRYLVRGLTLYRSLVRQAAPLTFWVLCLDEFTHEVLSRLNEPSIRPISLAEFEAGDEALLAAKRNRSLVEYYFTCTSSFQLYILDRHPEVDLLTYVDADLFFYSSPAPIYGELGDNSVLIVGHRFPAHLRHKEQFGIYNVGLVAFRNDRAGRACLEWWRERCLEWCYDRVEDGKFADQKYLDDWPTRFPGVVVLQHKGAGLAPWNWMSYELRIGTTPATVDGQPLIFYHLHNLKLLNRWLADPCTLLYQPMPTGLRQWLYAPYLEALRETLRWLRQLEPAVELGYSGLRIGSAGYGWRMFLRSLLKGQLVLGLT